MCGLLAPKIIVEVHRKTKTPVVVAHDGGLIKNPAITYSRAVRTTIGPRCLTAVFGMGTGVATWVWSPEFFFKDRLPFRG